MEAMDVKYHNGSVEKVRQAAAAPAVEAVTYKVCRKNHALATGGHTVDGCGEWMPLGDLNLADASSYNCAACGCHRSFHWKVMTEGSPPPPAMAATVLHGLPENDDERSVSPPQQPPPAPHPTPVTQQPPAYISSAPHMLPSLNSSAPGAPQNQRLPVQLSPATEPPPHGVMPARKKRTKFTDEQKQRMQELSERLGWRLQKRDAGIVDEGCRDIGVSKVVFKVWMHNNKHNYLIGRSAQRNASAAASSAATTPPAAPFNPSTSHSSPVPTATGFNMNGTASSASTASPIIAGGAQVNGASSQAQQSA